MKKVLVTGGSGFIGFNLVKKLKEQDYEIVVIDNYISGKRENKVDGVHYIEADTKEINHINLPFEPEAVFHLGEYSRIHPSFIDYENVWQWNTVGTFEVVNFCKKRSIKIVYAASSTKFAKEGVDHSPYSLTKSMSRDLIKAFSKWYGLNYSICYFYNVFGPGHSSSPVKGYESVISVFEEQYRKGEALTVSGTGEQKRMFTYVGDIVDGLILSLKYPENEEFELVNPIKSYSILEIAKMFSDNIKFVESRKGDRQTVQTQFYQDTCKKLNWKPTLSVEDWIKIVCFQR